MTEVARQEIEALLPWHAAGTLSRRDARRVEEALAADPELARQFTLVRDELSETIHLNETLGAPSARAMDRLLAGIDADGARPQRRLPWSAFAGFMSERLARISPRTLGWSATAAALVIALQGGLLAGLYVHERGGSGGFETASYQDGTGSYAQIRFDPKADIAEVSKFLESHNATVVDGPRKGMYRIRVAETALPQAELARLVKEMRGASPLVRFLEPVY
jgi:hypothetical protein